MQKTEKLNSLGAERRQV